MNYRMSDSAPVYALAIVVGALAGAALLVLTIVSAWSQPAADPVTIKVTRQQLLLIGQGLQELPAKVANPLLNELQAQLNAADEAAAKKAAPKPADQKAE